ncbi:histidine phosphatase family protein [uncultured Microscilla sp.]|uniref:SixA phosphatase family protein n=1 Tax=uncultured Microscilla sp. TaxID=432653 RepID=UPI00260AFA59|nr:histidine phosphatase family protein [uncultured Microscilla sp.]
MKTLTLLRHAKSSWKDLSLSDFERPLNKRGKRDAPFMAQKFKEKGAMPHLILSSPSVRTRLTVAAFVEVLPETAVEFDQRIYEAHAQTLLRLIRQQSDKVTSLVLVGHNPGLTDLTNYFAPGPIDNVPTTGIVQFNFVATQWKQITAKEASLVYFEYPKLYFPKEETK